MSDLDQIALMRLIDPQRGEFCKADKQGNPAPLPPTTREPAQDRLRNPRAVRHVAKTEQDYMGRDRRPRVALNQAQRDFSQSHKPTRSADYAKCPR